MSATQEQPDADERQMRQLESQAVGGASQTKSFKDHQEKFMDYLLETDLDDGTIDLISNLTQPDFVLGRLDPEHLHELLWWLRYVEEVIKSVHPPEEGISGQERGLLFEDNGRVLEPMNPQDLILLETAMEALRTRVTRSLGGFEREKLNESVDVTRLERTDRGDEDNSFLDILPRM